MKFVHEDSEFPKLLRIVAARLNLSPALVEKDYWVTHTLWSLMRSGFSVWLKGGTSLSKGFSLIERFSEDLDLKLEPGSVAAVPAVPSWTSSGKAALRARAAYFDALGGLVVVSGARIREDTGRRDHQQRSAELQVVYPGVHLAELDATMRPYVLLEIGNARVTPHVERDVTSFVHDELARVGQLPTYAANRPVALRCVHPYVTLLEKLDALHRRVPREDLSPATFVRHYEDAARIIQTESSLPPLDGPADVRELAAQMVLARQLGASVDEHDAAFNLPRGSRRDAILRAHTDIGGIFWGARISIADACAVIRGWIATRLPNRA